MQDLAGIRLADLPQRHPGWLVAADRKANELLGPAPWLMRKGHGDSGRHDQPTFKDWCDDPHGVVLAETTPGQIALADDAGCRLELLRGSILMPLSPTIPGPRTWRTCTARSRAGCWCTRRMLTKKPVHEGRVSDEAQRTRLEIELLKGQGG